MNGSSPTSPGVYAGVVDTRAYDRAAALGVFSEETARHLKTLYIDNRSAAYYRDTVATAEQAGMMFSLSVTIHDHVKNFSQQSYECCCND